jgi:hypothetical protein
MTSEKDPEAKADVSDPGTIRKRRAQHSQTYDIGYCKPPAASRFRPGQSGNPKGRPKGTQNASTILAEILARKVDMREGQKVRHVSVREAMLTGVVSRALKGDTKALETILKLDGRLGTLVTDEPTDAVLPEEDQAILATYLDRTRATKAESGNEEKHEQPITSEGETKAGSQEKLV